MSLSDTQRQVLVLVGLGCPRSALPSGHGVTQALQALVRKGYLAHNAVTDSYRRL